MKLLHLHVMLNEKLSGFILFKIFIIDEKSFKSQLNNFILLLKFLIFFVSKELCHLEIPKICIFL